MKERAADPQYVYRIEVHSYTHANICRVPSTILLGV